LLREAGNTEGILYVGQVNPWRELSEERSGRTKVLRVMPNLLVDATSPC